MNILYLTTHLNVGGITSYILSLSSALKKNGNNVYLASSGGELLPRFIEEGIIHTSIPIKTKSELSLKILISMFKLHKFMNENNIDIIHSNTRVTQVLGYLISKFFNKPHISTCHGFFKRRFSRRIFPCWGNKVIAISQEVRDHLIKDLDVKDKDVKVVYNGIDAERFQEPKPKNLNPRKKDLGLGSGPVVGIIARLSDVKGHIYLIEAMKKVVDKISDAQLLIIGEGKMRDKLLELTNHLGIGKNVFFIPSLKDTRQALGIMDLFVMPSLKEGLGLALMEAMAQGLAVIGSDVGGIKSLIQDGATGLLVKPADVEGLSLAILGLLKDTEKADNLGRNGRNFINQNFSREKMVLQTEKAYLECINGLN